MFKVLITGPESSGKSILASDLAIYFGGMFVSEYAREYLQNKDSYQEADLLQIALGQFRNERELEERTPTYLFCDTGLEVIEIWSMDKYNRVDPEIVTLSKQNKYDLVLLCKPNIPWKEDKLRENPTDRDRLFDIYEDKLVKDGVNFEIINASLGERVEQSISFVNNHCKSH